MDPEYQAQLHRLQQFRRSFAERNLGSAGSGSEVSDAEIGRVAGQGVEVQSVGEDAESQPVQDPLIFPGLYAPSGIDMLDILIRVRTRPNPVIDLGNIDSSVALILCDRALPDCPIVYCSEPFEVLTGYSNSEVLGRNCRFLQYPTPKALSNTKEASEMDILNGNARAKLRDQISKAEEVQVPLVNYKKGGERFVNLLTVVPIAWDEGDLGKRYMVGFQAQAKT